MHVLEVPWPGHCLCTIKNDCFARLAHQPGVLAYAIAVECMARFSRPTSGVRDWQKCPHLGFREVRARIRRKSGDWPVHHLMKAVHRICAAIGLASYVLGAAAKPAWQVLHPQTASLNGSSSTPAIRSVSKLYMCECVTPTAFDRRPICCSQVQPCSRGTQGEADCDPWVPLRCQSPCCTLAVRHLEHVSEAAIQMASAAQ